MQAPSLRCWAKDVSLVFFQCSSTKTREGSEEENQFRNIFRQIAGDVSMEMILVSATKAAEPQQHLKQLLKSDLL